MQRLSEIFSSCIPCTALSNIHKLHPQPKWMPNAPSTPKESNSLVQSRNILKKRNLIHLTLCNVVLDLLVMCNECISSIKTILDLPEQSIQNSAAKKNANPINQAQRSIKNTTKNQKKTLPMCVSSPQKTQEGINQLQGLTPPQGQGCLIRFICFKASSVGVDVSPTGLARFQPF